MVGESQSSLDEPDLPGNAIALKPLGVGSCRYQANYGGTMAGSLVCLGHPLAKLAPIGGIHPQDASPFHGKSIILLRPELRTLRILGPGANIPVKVELRIQRV